jgi:hypothetical protein
MKFLYRRPEEVSIWFLVQGVVDRPIFRWYKVSNL